MRGLPLPYYHYNKQQNLRTFFFLRSAYDTNPILNLYRPWHPSFCPSLRQLLFGPQVARSLAHPPICGSSLCEASTFVPTSGQPDDTGAAQTHVAAGGRRQTKHAAPLPRSSTLSSSIYIRAASVVTPADHQHHPVRWRRGIPDLYVPWSAWPPPRPCVAIALLTSPRNEHRKTPRAQCASATDACPEAVVAFGLSRGLLPYLARRSRLMAIHRCWAGGQLGAGKRRWWQSGNKAKKEEP